MMSSGSQPPLGGAAPVVIALAHPVRPSVKATDAVVMSFRRELADSRKGRRGLLYETMMILSAEA